MEKQPLVIDRQWPGTKAGGARLIGDDGKQEVDRILSIGFCGALDPALRIGDIVVSGEVPKGLQASFVQGDVVSVDRVAFTAQGKM